MQQSDRCSGNNSSTYREMETISTVPLYWGEYGDIISKLVRSRFIDASIFHSPEQCLVQVSLLYCFPFNFPQPLAIVPALANMAQFSNSWIFMSFTSLSFLTLQQSCLGNLHFQIHLIKQQLSVELTTFHSPSFSILRRTNTAYFRIVELCFQMPFSAQ